MADDRDNQWADPGRTDRLARREQHRRRLRRRRFGALAALLVGAVAVAAAVASLAGTSSSGDNASRPRGSTARRPNASGSWGSKARRPSRDGREAAQTAGPVRNATPQASWRPYTGPVPILEYHVLGAAPSDASYPELYVTRPDFHHQMDWLDSHGYQAVTLEAVEDAWYRRGTLPPKPIVISFDDGYRPQFTYALPELRRHGWPGVLNLKAEGSDLYTSNVEAMIDAGWELAAHTIHHLDLTTLDTEQLQEEIAGSRRMLRREYGIPVANFCYPAGRYDDTVIGAVEAAGYTGATTEIPGDADRQKPYELSRFEILGSTGVSGLAEDLASG